MSMQGGMVEDASILVGDYESFIGVSFVRCSITVGAAESRASFMSCTFDGCKINRNGVGALSYWRNCMFSTSCSFEGEDGTNQLLAQGATA